MFRGFVTIITASVFAAIAPAGDSFVNWEHGQVHPIDVTPDGSRLVVVNTADARLEVFDITTGTPVHIGTVPTGLNPVSVRARTDSEVWVVNHVSDSVSLIDLGALNVVATIQTGDEPADVVFAGTPQRAFVSCSQVNTVQVFDPNDLSADPTSIVIEAEDPRAMAVSPDGSTVYVAIFESGNGTTILGGGGTIGGLFPPNVVNDPLGPYGGMNPPPNDGGDFNPPQNLSNPAPPGVGIIVKKDGKSRWMDDNGGDWTELVSGSLASHSGRPIGWNLPDRDVAVLNADTLAVSYVSRLMNFVMAVAVNPATGGVTVIGTDATNHIRFEPVLSGRFLRVNIALFDSAADGASTVVDLNPHLTYMTSTIPQDQRDLSIGDPRGLVWNAAGTRGYVTGMGSNNLVVIDSTGARAGLTSTIEVGEGPTGVVLDESNNRLYVLNRFEASLSVIDTVSESEVNRVSLFDPTPSAIKIGRKHLYDTHKNSGLGQIACASCHVDSRMDRLAWDLGNPAGEMKTFDQNCNFGAGFLIGAPPCEDWHPMKGPMTTQTLQDIIGKEPHHWRGDRNGIEEFQGAFTSLMGDDETPTNAEMQEFEAFLATITFPPNPFRNFDNALPGDLELIGHFTTGRFGPAGQPLPNGDAANGLDRYRVGLLDGVNCVTCHTLPTGVGTNLRLVGGNFLPFPTGPNGEIHHTVVSVDGSTNVSIKIPQLRNMYEKVGLEMTQTSNAAGFGFLHDGSVDSLARFVSEPVFEVTSDQDVADLVAFMLSFAGSDLPSGSTTNVFELLGPAGNDTHAAVGTKLTVDDTNRNDAELIALLGQMTALAGGAAVGLVAKGIQAGLQRGYVYTGADTFQSDRESETLGTDDLRLAADAGAEITFTVVPVGTQERIGVDRDEDGFFDRDELDACSDPADPESTPASVVVTDCHDFDACTLDECIAGTCFNIDRLYGDIDGDGDIDLFDLFCVLNGFNGDFSTCSFVNIDIEPCEGDGDVDLFDLFAVLNAFGGADTCCGGLP